MWATPLAKWRARAGELVTTQMPAVAAALPYRQRVLPVLLHMTGMNRAPRELVRLKRDALGRGFCLAGGAMPISGQRDIRQWGFADIGACCAGAGDAVAFAATLLAPRTGHGGIAADEPSRARAGDALPIAIARRGVFTPTTASDA